MFGARTLKAGSDAAAAVLTSGAATAHATAEPQPATPQTEVNVAQSALTGSRADPQHLSEEARQQLTEGEKQFALGLMRVISVLAQSSRYRHYTISDLEWLILPPLQLGQCAILHAETPGLPVATAVALWANVSTDVDLRFSQNLTSPIRLRPDEWRSGENLWLIDVIGPKDAVSMLLRRLQTDAFKHRRPKIKRLNADGQAEVALLDVRM